MTQTIPPVITIDGPGGAGKGTVALRVARYLGWHTLDSGALYRVLAIAAQRHQINVNDEIALAELANHLAVNFVTMPDLSGNRVILDEQEVTTELRTESCGTLASQIATLPSVRQALLARQRAFRQPPGLVADGRDMGSIVFPEASHKFFLTASCEERAHRRYKQLKEKGVDANMEILIKEITERDQRDSTRATAPLIATAAATVIDTTGVPIESVVAHILRQVFADKVTAR
ncbi:MAG: cytidylate kinase [Beggiatoa sp. IS2]|nr:MAG: cytidylate kinase [Beggiatoa sp. IS2]